MGQVKDVGKFLFWVAKWATRGLLALVAVAAIVWSIMLFAGSMRLQEALEAVRSEPKLMNPAPKNWDIGGPGDNGGPYFAAAFALHRYWGHEIGLPVQKVLQEGWAAISEEQQAKIRSWLESKKSAFDLAAEGARRPWCRFVRSWTSNPWEIYAPEIGGVAFLGRSLILRAEMQSADGDPAGARESIRLAFAVADTLRDEPPRECLSFRMGLHEQIMTSLLRLIPSEVTVQDCDEWRRLLPDLSTYNGLLERAYLWDLHVLVDVLSGPLDRFWHAWAEANHRVGRGSGFQRRLADPWVKIDGVRALEELQRMIGVIGKPYPEAHAELRKMWSEWHNRSRSWNPVRAVFVIPASWHLDCVQSNRALSTLLHTGLDWERTRIETGKYPDRCETVDPFTGQALVLEEGPRRLTSGGAKGWSLESQGGGVTVRGRPLSWVLRGK